MIDIYAREELEIEWNSQFDAVREMYAGTEEDPRTLELEFEDRWCEEMQDHCDRLEAEGGPIFEAFVDPMADLGDIPF